MAAGSTDQPAPDGGGQGERYGILALVRVRKDDGRSLILYSHDEDSGDGGETSGASPAGDGGRA